MRGISGRGMRPYTLATNPSGLKAAETRGSEYVAPDHVHETMLDTSEGDHPLGPLREGAQIPQDVAADLNLHGRLAEVDIAAIVQFKLHQFHPPIHTHQVVSWLDQKATACSSAAGALFATLLGKRITPLRKHHLFFFPTQPHNAPVYRRAGGQFEPHGPCLVANLPNKGLHQPTVLGSKAWQIRSDR
jgi:hypothetical protein